MTKGEKTKISGAAACEESNLNQEYVSEQIYHTDLRKPALLLHSCCGPCSTSVIFDLIHSYTITIYFYNPNITDYVEYQKRVGSQKKFIEEYNNQVDKVDTIAFIEGQYEPERFFDETKALHEEHEGGERCRKCFLMRLDKTAATAKLGGFECFATTLSVSPHKNYNVLSEIGHDLCTRYGIGFIDKDYKKNGGYQKSIELSKLYSLYRQSYCGCEFSKI
jgi:predicted adenine nucleotide alpha hydrolase (AANH) superfamily ATPase